MGQLLDASTVPPVSRTRVPRRGNDRRRAPHPPAVVVSRPPPAGNTLALQERTPPMKFLFRITVLALAAVGARTLFERVRPRVSGATGAGTVVSETLTPAVKEAAANVKQAST